VERRKLLAQERFQVAITILINAVHQFLGLEKLKALPFFHAFTGTTLTLFPNSMAAWDARKAYEDEQTFACITEQPGLSATHSGIREYGALYTYAL
jgi:hypothetical protein